jgi:hypothetical protein
MASAVVRLALAAGLLGPVASSVAAQEQAGIATYRNERHGFSLNYPAGTFAPQPPAADGEGRVFVSRDGNARLLAGALPNADGVNLRDYRSLVLQQSYPGADIDYAPVGAHVVRALRHARRRHVLRARDVHLRRAPHQQLGHALSRRRKRRVWDRIVEQVARSYRAGEGNCG